MIFGRSIQRRLARVQQGKALAKALTKAPIDQIQHSLSLFVRSWGNQDKKFMPHLATWLNGERWDDEIQQPSLQDMTSDQQMQAILGSLATDRKMTPMNYEQRTKAIGAWLQKELQSYDVPANHTPERAATEMTAMVEDINSEIVSSINEEGLTNILRNMGKDIRKNNRTRSWPTIYNMVKAAQKCSDAYKPPILGPSKSVAWDSDAIEARTNEPGRSSRRDLHHRIRSRQTARKKPRHDGRDSNVSAKPGRKPHRDICPKRAASRPNRGLPVLESQATQSQRSASLCNRSHQSNQRPTHHAINSQSAGSLLLLC